MKKTISINKMNRKQRDAIIKVDSRIVSVNLEVEMASKAPAWFTDWTTSFEKKNDARWEKQEKFNERIESKVDENSKNIMLILKCPTIKKEIKEA